MTDVDCRSAGRLMASTAVLKNLIFIKHVCMYVSMYVDTYIHTCFICCRRSVIMSAKC